ncbi:MAG: hypothetical protein PUC30_03740 [Lachnospiraceae bacterium]|nr:hypothetical protein [Lachnospiraceae bacterium]
MKIFLFSTDVYFVEAFSGLLGKRRHDIELYCFSDEEIARQQVRNCKYSVMLCEQGYLREYIGKEFYIELGNITIMPKEDKSGQINIYQRADLILEDLDHILSLAEGRNVENAGLGKKMAFYSTEGGAGKTTLAYLTSVMSAKKRKTLYFDLCPLAKNNNLYNVEFRHTMEEVLYAQHENSGVLEIIYETMVCNEDGVYVLPAIKSLGDYKELSAEVVKKLCEHAAGTGIERVVLDLPCTFNTWAEEILQFCDKVIWVYGSTDGSRKKEEAVKTDPYMKRMLDKSIFVKNRSQHKGEAEIEFPFSSTMQKAGQISKVLEVNPEFVTGCLAIDKELM